MMKNKPTKQVLFETAMQLFRQYGYEKVSISRICKKADTTRNAFYYYYTSKEDLLTSYFELAPFSESGLLEGLLRQNSDWSKLLYLYEEHVRLLVKEGPALTRQFIIASMITGKNMLIKYELTSTLSAPLFKLCKESGLIQSPLNVEQLQYLTNQLCVGVVLEWCVSDGAFDVVSRIRQVLIGSLRPELLHPGEHN